MNYAEQIPGLDFTAIDFETANAARASACAVGLARVRDGRIVASRSQLLCPPPGHDAFHERNVGIHGITPDAVVGAPTWADFLPELMDFIGADALVAHNAVFDRSVFQQSCSVVDVDWPPNHWFDTLALSRAQLTLASYRLDVVSRYLELPEFDHHEAEADAQQAALLAIALNNKTGTGSMADLHAQCGAAVMHAARGGGEGEPAGFDALTEKEALAGENVVFTGALTTLKRAEAKELVESAGARVQSGVTKTTTIVVAGDFDPATLRPGASLSHKLEKAREYAEQGQPLEILTESDLLERIEVSREEAERVARQRRAAANAGWFPLYILDQARALDPSLNYNAWLRAALRHPDGRAGLGTVCVRCSAPVGDAMWLFLERHVCSGDCNEALKNKAKKEWRRAGISRPEAPSYAESWGRADRRR